MTKLIIQSIIRTSLAIWFIIALVLPETGPWTVTLLIIWYLNDEIGDLNIDILELKASKLESKINDAIACTIAKEKAQNNSKNSKFMQKLNDVMDRHKKA